MVHEPTAIHSQKYVLIIDAFFNYISTTSIMFCESPRVLPPASSINAPTKTA